MAETPPSRPPTPDSHQVEVSVPARPSNAIVLLAADTRDEAGDVDFVAAVAGVDGNEGERRMRSQLRASAIRGARKPVSSGWRREEWRFSTGAGRGSGQEAGAGSGAGRAGG